MSGRDTEKPKSLKGYTNCFSFCYLPLSRVPHKKIKLKSNSCISSSSAVYRHACALWFTSVTYLMLKLHKVLT